ncbi:MAG: hypothetical protein ACXVFT_18595 [Solirubrobacteraceae bacterium]
MAVARIRIVTGLDPHEKLILPPARTAATTAEEVQLPAVPRPITRAPATGWTAATGDDATRAGERDGDAARVEADPTTIASAPTDTTAAT